MANPAEVFAVNLQLMEKKTLRVMLMERPASTTDATLGAEAKLNITAGTIWIYHEERGGLEGTVDSATTSTIKDASFDEADSTWKYLLLQFTSGTYEGKEWEISGFTSDGTFTLDVAGVPIPLAPVTGTTFRLPGRALLGPTAMTIAQGMASYQIGPTNGITSTKGRKVARALLTYTTSGGDADQRVATWVIDVHE